MFAPAARRAFSLIELVIVVVIIGIIAAIAIPRMSRGATGAADGSLTADLAVLRNAVDLFQAEHQGTYPTDNTTLVAQITGYTDINGVVGTKGDGKSIYGPYLRAIPPLPVGNDKGKTSIVAAYASGNGWIYVGSTGSITANTNTEADAAGKLYNTY
jgi:prepilin-type N-terminal cleavage/methylation domain-containing protein